jgi:MFS family permease
MPTVSESVSGGIYGLGWQGRYTLPVAVGVPIVAGWLIDRWGPRSSAPAAVLVVLGVVGAGIGQGWALLTMLNRYSVGLPTSALGLRSAVDWHGPLQPFTLFLLGVAAGTAWVAWLLVLAFRPVTPAPAAAAPASTPDPTPPPGPTPPELVMI